MISRSELGGKGMGSGFCLYESDRDRYGNRDSERLSQVYHLSFGVSDENIRLLYASVDLIDMYLRLSDKYGMKFFFGTQV